MGSSRVQILVLITSAKMLIPNILRSCWTQTLRSPNRKSTKRFKDLFAGSLRLFITCVH